MSRRQSIYMNYRAGREKLGRPPIKDHRWKQKFLRWHLFETPINSKTTDGLLINLTRSPRKKDARGHPTRSEIASFCPPPPLWISVALRGEVGGGGGGYGYFLELHILVWQFCNSWPFDYFIPCAFKSPICFALSLSASVRLSFKPLR